MTSSWKPPSWAQIPPTTHQWHLDELKNGNTVATHSLNDLLSSSSNNNRRCITFGRVDDPTQIDIVTAHESCSRLHARLAFTSIGTPYLKDLASGNGTFVNNKQLPNEACGKWECTNSSEVEVRGSRGVVVHPGDAIRFGCSTRIFVLEGPEEFERGAIRVTKKKDEKMLVVDDNNAKLQERNAKDDEASAASAVKNEEVCTWGMSTAEYSDEQDEGEEQPRQSQSTGNLPSMDSFFSSPTGVQNPLQQLYNQYQTKLYKLEAISTESKRISQKEDMGVELTDGQRNQMAKNQDKLTALEASVGGLKERIEEGMHVAIYGRPLNRQSQKKGGGGYSDADDVDDFFDRTASPSKRQRDYDEEEAESEVSLIEKWKELLQSYSKQQNVVSSTTQRCNALQRQIDSASDEEDAFFVQNGLNLAMDDVKKATCRLEEIEHDFKDAEQLLKIVNPKLSWDREQGLIGTDLQINAKKTTANRAVHESVQHVANVEEQNDESIIMMMPPPPKTVTATTITTSDTSFEMLPPPAMMTTAAATSAVTSFDMMPPPPKAPESMANATKEGVITEHPMNPNHIDRGITPQEEGEQPLYQKKKKRQLGPMRPPPTSGGTQGQGTLAVLKQFTSHTNESTYDSHHAKKQKKSNDDSATLSFDPRKDEWNAPSDQDGSGRTSLHDKFKGRY
jgi:pSer/pThr/pTyr-binding forkhead associated (FHA) protein